MKVVILAGGYGTRIGEESHLRPKPMIEIGGNPILWHIQKYYSAFGFNEFIICCGYKGYMIKKYFADYYLHRSDVTFDFSYGGRMTVHANVSEPWKVTLVDTGNDVQTGGRIKRIEPYIGNECFMLTYGDGVSDVDLRALLRQHEASGKTVTLTAIQPGLFNYIKNVRTVLERVPLEQLSAQGKLGVYYWQCLDTQRDKGALERAWRDSNARWKVWQ